jgi:hypothetical protein
MKMPTRKFLIIVLAFISLDSFAQEWVTGRYYGYRGQTLIENTYRTEYNPYSGLYFNNKYCRQLTWYQEYYSGYVYFWQYSPAHGLYRWANNWQEGNFWRCTWSDWYSCE